LDTYFCDRKRLLCEAITPPSRQVSTWWQLLQTKGGQTSDMYSTTQSSGAASDHIFGTERTWSIEVEAKIEGSYKDMVKGSITMTAKYQKTTFEQLKSAYSESLTSEHIKTCEPKCLDEDKNGYLWMTRVDLVDKTSTSNSSFGSFQAIPDCFVQCVSAGMEPLCPPMYCEDDDCQCCSKSMEDALIGARTACPLLASTALQPYYCWQLALFFPALLGVLAGMWQPLV